MARAVPIATAEREADAAQGSVTLFFHENKDNRGAPSAKVFGVSNCHVLREKTNVKYEFKGAGAPRQLVPVARGRRFQRGIEIKAYIGGHGTDADLNSAISLAKRPLAREIAELEAKPKSEDLDEAAEEMATVDDKRAKLDKLTRLTDLTVGRYAGLGAYLCDELGGRPLAVQTAIVVVNCGF